MTSGLSFVLHQCATPGMMGLVMTTFILPLMLLLMQTLFDEAGTRPGFWCWLREWGAPVLLTTSGLMFLLGGVIAGDDHAEPTLTQVVVIPPSGPAGVEPTDELVCQSVSGTMEQTACYWVPQK